jgi:DNA-binding PadR family transcriptional regulator
VSDALTDGELTVLGLLAEAPRHGYELDRVIEQRGIREWTTLGFSSIYYLLDRLAGLGLIEAGERGGRRRASYRLTAAGWARLAEQSADALEVLTPVRARVLIGMANSLVVDPAEVDRRLRNRVTRLQAELDRIRARRAEQEPLPEHVHAIFDYGEALLLADLRWAQDLLNRRSTMTKRDAEVTTKQDAEAATRHDPKAATKYDVKVAHRELYAPSAKDFSIVDVPEMTYLAIDGAGDPNTSAEYAAAVEALYTLAYTIKSHSRTALGRDFVVAPLEGLWRADDMSAFLRREKSAWQWTMLIALPDWITSDVVEIARAAARKKKNLPAIDAVTVRTLAEGRCVQILHIGSYDDEGPVLDRLHNTYLPQHGLRPTGDHHEIYLSDPRRTAPEKLKTILRQPVAPVETPAQPGRAKRP